MNCQPGKECLIRRRSSLVRDSLAFTLLQPSSTSALELLTMSSYVDFEQTRGMRRGAFLFEVG